jgi:transposase, IS5 family
VLDFVWHFGCGAYSHLQGFEVERRKSWSFCPRKSFASFHHSAGVIPLSSEERPMRPKPIPTPDASEADMFRHRLENMIDMRHELVRATGLIDWKRFDDAFGGLYAEKGRPGLATRLMVGLHLLKHARGLSDEQVCAQWLENPYFQFFCGETWFQTRLPLDRTSMSVWRGRIGPGKLEELLAETLAAATRAGAVAPSQMQRVTIDTTAQTKAIAHPTDSHLLLRAIEWLNRLARTQGVRLRQSYLRVARYARREVGRLIHGRGHKQALRHLRKMRTWAGRLVRDIERKVAGNPDLERVSAPVLDLVKALLAQKPDDKNKIYALHAPEVECIAKGKTRTRYEFGVKTSIAVTNARAAGGQFVVGVHTCPGLPYDGHTLKDQIAQVERLTGIVVTRAYVDKGYRGHGLTSPDVHVTQSKVPRTPTIRRELRRRSAIEAVIGHTKSDGLLERNHLAGAHGDAVNAILVGAGHNMRLLLAWLRRLLSFLCAIILLMMASAITGAAPRLLLARR